jgi:hypothetical protein
VPTTPARPAQLVGRVFRGSSVVAQGLLTKKQLRSSAWVRLRQDVYADATLPLTHRLLVSAVGLVLPEGAGFAARSAAVLWGVPDIAGAADPVEVVLPPGVRWNAGSDVRARSLMAGQQLVRRGRWLCTSRVDTAVALIRRVTSTNPWCCSTACAVLAWSGCRTCAKRSPAFPGIAGWSVREPSPSGPMGSRSHPRRPGCGFSSGGRGCRCLLRNSGCSTKTDSSPGWISPIQSSGSRSSTTGSGTESARPS